MKKLCILFTLVALVLLICPIFTCTAMAQLTSDTLISSSANHPSGYHLVLAGQHMLGGVILNGIGTLMLVGGQLINPALAISISSYGGLILMVAGLFVDIAGMIHLIKAGRLLSRIHLQIDT